MMKSSTIPPLTAWARSLLGTVRRVVGRGLAFAGPRPLPAYIRCRPLGGARPVLNR